MKIMVNGEPREIDAATLAAALDELGYGGTVVATALNGEFTPVSRRAAVRIEEGDRLEVLAPMQGG